MDQGIFSLSRPSPGSSRKAIPVHNSLEVLASKARIRPMLLHRAPPIVDFMGVSALILQHIDAVVQIVLGEL